MQCGLLLLWAVFGVSAVASDGPVSMKVSGTVWAETALALPGILDVTRFSGQLIVPTAPSTWSGQAFEVRAIFDFDSYSLSARLQFGQTGQPLYLYDTISWMEGSGDVLMTPNPRIGMSRERRWD
jgi:hypothetical protein